METPFASARWNVAFPAPPLSEEHSHDMDQDDNDDDDDDIQSLSTFADCTVNSDILTIDGRTAPWLVRKQQQQQGKERPAVLDLTDPTLLGDSSSSDDEYHDKHVDDDLFLWSNDNSNDNSNINTSWEPTWEPSWEHHDVEVPSNRDTHPLKVGPTIATGTSTNAAAATADVTSSDDQDESTLNTSGEEPVPAQHDTDGTIVRKHRKVLQKLKLSLPKRFKNLPWKTTTASKTTLTAMTKTPTQTNDTNTRSIPAAMVDDEIDNVSQQQSSTSMTHRPFSELVTLLYHGVFGGDEYQQQQGHDGSFPTTTRNQNNDSLEMVTLENQEWTLDDHQSPPLKVTNNDREVASTATKQLPNASRRRWYIVGCLACLVLASCSLAVGLAASQKSNQSSHSDDDEVVASIFESRPGTSTESEGASGVTVVIPPGGGGATSTPTAAPTPFVPTTVDFAALGDAPYDNKQARTLKKQMENLNEDLQFVIHVGDVRSAAADTDCTRDEFQEVADILRESPVPVFVLLGDNDWVDCPNTEEGLEHWNNVFLHFHNQWDHSFHIVRQPRHPHNFGFIHQNVLFIGLNMPGSSPEDESEGDWESRLIEQWVWSRSLMEDYVEGLFPHKGRIVLFGHANPDANHRMFFGRLADFIDEKLDNETPVLYINGDDHEWSFDTNYYGQESFVRIMVAGETQEAPTSIRVVANGAYLEVEAAFEYQRNYN